MKLSILTDNHAGGHFLAEHGLSYLVEHDGKKILFDTGHSDVFLKNAQKLGIDLQQTVDMIVISHGHWDHANGLAHLDSLPLLTHPATFTQRFRKKDDTTVGLHLSLQEVQEKFQLTSSQQARQITEQIFFLGEIPRKTPFETQTTTFKDAQGNEDFIPDDTALALIQHKKLTIVTGCSHSGIANICEHAKAVTGIQQIERIIGGFHLKENNLQTQETIRYFKHEKIKELYPSHCTELPALTAFYQEFGIQQLKTGLVLNWD